MKILCFSQSMTIYYWIFCYFTYCLLLLLVVPILLLLFILFMWFPFIILSLFVVTTVLVICYCYLLWLEKEWVVPTTDGNINLSSLHILCYTNILSNSFSIYSIYTSSCECYCSPWWWPPWLPEFEIPNPPLC